MLAIASQTAGSNGRTFFEGTLEYPGSKKARKQFFFFENSIEKILRVTPGTSASFY